jgi:hypothetical protein
MDRCTQQAWLAQWRNASVALAQQRARELRELTATAALAASEAVLSLALSLPVSPKRLTSSGLVRQQELLCRRRGK